ncbi:MAG: conjugal transfer protein TraF [Desulfobulbaceae bacterium]|nr:conjugal transfer protein TraF [Desulfobulbaceae bacterium]
MVVLMARKTAGQAQGCIITPLDIVKRRILLKFNPEPKNGFLSVAGFSIWLCCWLLAVTMTTKALAEDVSLPQPAFYETAKEGWFWYKDPPPDEKFKEPLNLQNATITREAGPKVFESINPSMDKYTIDDIWNLHPDEFQGLLNGVQKKAVQTPNEKNILEYLILQDVARRKALAYANATKFVVQKYSDKFNINQVYPTTTPGISARVQEQQKEIYSTITAARENHALLFFVSHGCGFCDKQTAILTYFVEKYGWQIKLIDIDQETTLAARFNITTTPTLILIKDGTEQAMPISVGVVAQSELERKLYQAIRYLGGETNINTFQTYDYQKGGALDPGAILETEEQPWRAR